MGRRTKRGTCAVCGAYGDLTFEHVPPSSCYNTTSVRLLEGMDALQLSPDANPRHRISQRGMGNYYTCATCNNKSGRWYVPETQQWVARAADVLGTIGGRDGQDASVHPRLVYVAFAGVRPLLFLKQVVYMFLCINGASFTERQPGMRSFVLNRDSQSFSDEWHVNIGLTWGPGARTVGGTAVADLLGAGGATYLSDLSYPPLHYAMWQGHPYRLLVPCEISQFKRYGPEDVTDVTLPLQVGFTHGPMPGDLRSKAAMERQAAENLRDRQG